MISIKVTRFSAFRDHKYNLKVIFYQAKQVGAVSLRPTFGYNVDVAKVACTRPDRAEALRSIHDVAHDKGFREAVKKLLEETG